MQRKLLLYLVHVDGLMQERRNSIANTLELRLSCTNPSLYTCIYILLGYTKQTLSESEFAHFLNSWEIFHVAHY